MVKRCDWIPMVPNDPMKFNPDENTLIGHILIMLKMFLYADLF